LTIGFLGLTLTPMPNRRLLAVILVVLLPIIGGTVAYSATSSPGKSGSAPGKQKAGQEQSTEQENEAEEPEGEGIPGGTIDRYHGSDCRQPDGVAALEGNWTHGMYVSAWATTNDPTKIVEAAHSRCGKPAHAGLHGPFGARGLPPGLAKKAENQPTP
jgi:hypothetical protein